MQSDKLFYFFLDIRASKETVPPPSLTSSKLCTSATNTVRSWASSPCSPNLKSLHLLPNPNPNPLLHPRRKHLGQQWRASHNRRRIFGLWGFHFYWTGEGLVDLICFAHVGPRLAEFGLSKMNQKVLGCRWKMTEETDGFDSGGSHCCCIGVFATSHVEHLRDIYLF